MNHNPRTCCFSGHRPGKLPFGYHEDHPDCLRLKFLLLSEINNLRKRGVTDFITGMAQGTDLIAAELVLEIKRACPDAKIRLLAAVPYDGQASRWTAQSRGRYFQILSKADGVVTLEKQYTDSCLLARNRYMVDASAHLIAVWNGAEGGTKYTVDYAIKKGLDVIIFNPDTLGRERIPPARSILSFPSRLFPFE